MATLTGSLALTRVHIGVVGQPSTNVTSGSAGSIGGGGSRNDEFSMTGEFRSYANGITRLILGSGTTRTQTLVLRALTPSQVKQVDSMVGKLCVFRDNYGRKVFGSFTDTQKTDIPLSGRVSDNTLKTDVAITITTLTYNEAV